jgi:integrase
MMRSDTALEMVLRRAMGRAGLAENWKHVCRRRSCGYREQATSGELRRCPKCQMKLWPMPQPRPLRFHDLRHGTASLLFMAGADAVAVQKLMRHRDLRMTIGTYGHLTPGYMRAEVDRLRFLPDATGSNGAPENAPPLPLGRLNQASPPAPPTPGSVGNLNQLGPTLVQDGAGNEKAPRPGDRNPEESWALVPARSTGLEPVTSGVTGRRSNQLN